MADRKLPLPTVVHLCPVCHRPQTKIQRKLGNDQHGATNYVCARSECVVGINLTGTFMVTQRAIPLLKQSSAGSIIVMSSLNLIAGEMDG